MRILIVEDEPTLGKQLKSTLEGAGYAVDLSTDGEDGHYMGSTENYDAVILDLGLPEIDGLTVLDRWRKEGRKFPVLVLTARDSWSDKVAGLDAGADDYLAKPFNLEELMLRIQVLIPRQTRSYKLGLFELDFESMEVSNTTTQEIHTLSKKEMTLLKLFVENENRVLSRDEILDKVWGEDVYPTTRTIDNFVLAFRKMFEGDQKHPKYFHSIRGVGYKFINQSN